jgi:hypothetical protein
MKKEKEKNQATWAPLLNGPQYKGITGIMHVW